MVNMLQALPAMSTTTTTSAQNSNFLVQFYHETVYMTILMLFLDVAILFQGIVKQLSPQQESIIRAEKQAGIAAKGYDLAIARKLAADAIRHSAVLVLVSSTILVGYFRISGVTVQAISIVGGILLFPIGWQMTKTLQEESSKVNHQTVAIVPLAFPWIIGGGAISYIIKQEQTAISQHDWPGLGALALAIAIALFQAWLGMRFAHFLVRWIPESWQIALNAIVGIVIMALAVQMALDAVLTIIASAKLS
jgi:small neutral amino acid transporter SnatA (MarC family)